MKIAGVIILLVVAGCSTPKNQDARLEGTWRDADCPRMVTYSNGVGWVSAPGRTRNFLADVGRSLPSIGNLCVTNKFRYRIVRHGEDYLDIRYPDFPYRNEPIYAVEDGKTIVAYGLIASGERIHFTEDGKALWVGEETSHRTWLYRVTPASSEPDGPANRSQPIRTETNRTSSAAGSRR
jgi:hypothetical protein